MSGAIHVVRVGPERLSDCLAIRRVVFIEGQDVPEDLEVDGLDDVCLHVLATHEGRPVGTARLRRVDGGAKVERVAVLAQVRGRGIGREIMHALHAEADRLDLDRVVLNAQEAVIGFYRDLGYRSVGEGFMEADIPHQKMVLDAPFDRR